jgi:hypothetical protein
MALTESCNIIDHPINPNAMHLFTSIIKQLLSKSSFMVEYKLKYFLHNLTIFIPYSQSFILSALSNDNKNYCKWQKL